MKIYLNSDNMLTVTVTKQEDGSTVTGATVTVELVDLEGNSIPGELWPLELYEHPPGNYYNTLKSDLDLEPFQRLRCRVWARSGMWHTYAEVPTQVVVDRD